MRKETRYETQIVNKEDVYISKDGKEFKTEVACLQYEEQLKKNAPIRKYLNSPFEMGNWYYIGNDSQRKAVQDALGWNRECWKYNRETHGEEWVVGEWYASNIHELDNFGYGWQYTLRVYSLTEYEKEMSMAFEEIRTPQQLLL